MGIYLLKRIAYLIPILLGVNLLVFSLFFLVNSPDDMAKQFLGEKSATPEQIERWKAARGYELPLLFNSNANGIGHFTRTILFTKSLSLFWGDFGNSDHSVQPIIPELRKRLPPSFLLALPMFLLTLAANIYLAMQSAARRGSLADRGGQLLCVVLMSVSSIVLIIFGQYLFASKLRLCPVSGFEQGSATLRFLMLPIAVGVFCSLGSGTRLYRTFFLEQLGQDFVRTARAKGLPEHTVLYRHVLPNALLPILTNIPSYLLTLFTGNLLLEKFFNIPGLGSYTIDAIAAQDFAAMRAMVFLGAAIYALGLLLTDVAYCLADPRIKLK